MLLDGKKLVVTGVLTDSSIAFAAARLAQEQGAEIVLTSFGRATKLTERAARRLPDPPDILELDVTDADTPRRACAPSSNGGGERSTACCTPWLRARGRASAADSSTRSWDDVAIALHVSAYSLKSLAAAVTPADAGRRRARRRARLRRHPGVAAVRLDGRGQGRARVNRSVPRARPRACRSPRRTWCAPARCARSRRSVHPRVLGFEDVWTKRAPLGWNVADPEPVGPRVRRPAVGLVPRHDRRDAARRRRLPCRGRGMIAPDLLPHRSPFRFVDEVIACEPGRGAETRFTVRADEPCLAGHFPGRPIFPGVLQLEALAQTGALAVLADPRFAGALPLFGGVDDVRFRRVVVPGDDLHLCTTLDRLSARGGWGRGEAHVDGVLACRARLLFVLAPPD